MFFPDGPLICCAFDLKTLIQSHLDLDPGCSVGWHSACIKLLLVPWPMRVGEFSITKDIQRTKRMMGQTNAKNSGIAIQAVMLAVFLVALSIWSVWFFLQRVWWFPELASVHGADSDREFQITLAITGFMFIVVQVGLGFLVTRFGSGNGGRLIVPSLLFEKRFAITAALIVFLVDISLFATGEVAYRRAYGNLPSDSLLVEAVGEQFAWNFRYPGPDGEFGRTDPSLTNLESNPLGLDPDDPRGDDDIVMINQMHVPVDELVRVRIRAKDVLHSFALPNFRIKQDAVPGMEINVGFEPTRTGQFEIMCAQLCGLGHYRMRAFLTVETREEFDLWLAESAGALQ